MRSFPPSYISNAPGHPNPHLAATYMANLNKAAAYAAAAAASRHSVMTTTAAAAAAAGPNYGPQTPMATSVTSQEDLRLQQEPYGGHNIYAVSFKYLPIFIFSYVGNDVRKNDWNENDENKSGMKNFKGNKKDVNWSGNDLNGNEKSKNG